MKRLRLVLGALALLLPAPQGYAASPKRIRVEVGFAIGETRTRDVLHGTAGVEMLGGRFRAPGGMSLMSTERRTKRSANLSTRVTDGGRSTLMIAKRIPRREIDYFYDAAWKAGYAASRKRFARVGTAFEVDASVLSDRQIRLRLTPSVHYSSREGSGIVEFADRATELVVESGERVVIGDGGRLVDDEVTRRILGSAEGVEEKTTITLTATLE